MPGEVQSAQVSVVTGRDRRSYLLPPGSRLAGMEFKSLQAGGLGCLLPCVRSRYNGQLKLTYFTEGTVGLEAVLASMQPEQYLAFGRSVLQAVLEVSRNGFLDASRLDLDPSALYVDPSSCDARLIYLPVEPPEGGPAEGDAFGTTCQALMTPARETPQLRSVVRTLATAANASGGSLERMLGQLSPSSSASAPPLTPVAIDETSLAEPDSRLTAPDTDSRSFAAIGYVLAGEVGGVRVELPIRRGVMTLGKSTNRADVVISGVPTVSNRHCQVTWDEQGLEVRDLESTNGTFVNGRRLPRGGSASLHVGDALGLGTVSLVVGTGA